MRTHARSILTLTLAGQVLGLSPAAVESDTGQGARVLDKVWSITHDHLLDSELNGIDW